MKDSFWWGYDVTNFFFEGLNIKTPLYFVLVCLMLTVLAFCFEWLKMIQIRIRNTRIRSTQKQMKKICSSERDSLLTDAQEAAQPPTSLDGRGSCFQFSFDLVLWLGQQLVAYMLMLSVMFFNGYFMVVVVLGAAIGYFVFGPTFIRLNLENCQTARSTYCSNECLDPDKAALLRSRSSNSSITEADMSAASTSAIASVHQ